MPNTIDRHFSSVPVQKVKVKDEDIVTVAQEIRNYLMAHPNAADSLEGIVKWWLTRQRYEEAMGQVQKALDYLVVRGDISKRQLSSGKVIYSSGAHDQRGMH